MMISNDRLNEVKNVFEKHVDFAKIRMDIDFPFFNVYDWKGQVFFSNGYKSYNLACEYSDQEFYAQIPKVWNAKQNEVKWLGCLNGSKVIVDKSY